MKRIAVLMLIFTLMISACSPGAFAAPEKALTGAGIITVKDELSKEVYTTEKGYMYRLKPDDTAVVCGAPDGVEDVVIPKKVDGHKVTGISSYNQRFQGVSEAKSLTVPEGVLTITGYVLNNFRKVETINLPSSLVHIDFQSFFIDTEYGKNPENWDNGVMYIGTNILLVKRDVPETLIVREGTTCVADIPIVYTDTVIKEVVFPKNFVYGLEGLTNSYLERATVPAELGVVTDGLFSGCENLTEVIIEEGITSIGKNAFAWCKNLTSVEIPQSVTHIGEDAFVTCENLKKICVPSSVSSIDAHAFGYEKYSQRDMYTKEYVTKYRYYNDFVLCGETGSAAHRYAQENEIRLDAGVQFQSSYDECFGKIGDSNTDGNINVKDATAIQKHLADLVPLAENGLKLADADNNDALNIKDASAIQKYIAGLNTGLEVGKKSDIRLFYVIYAQKALDWYIEGAKLTLYYYMYEGDDMVDFPGVQGEYDALHGGYRFVVPVQARYIEVVYDGTFRSLNNPMPNKDGVIVKPVINEMGKYELVCQ